MATIPRNAEPLRASLNELARKLYRRQGYEVRKGYDFQNARHPQELATWEMAIMAWEHCVGALDEDLLSDWEDD